ncbi:tRNA (adenosine(37)-N6)-dimethylallyltransferase MiaA [Glaciecola sp. KUL10]|uniref:tRNA (adenosine(37)-N6)-dimethylallyltransferase MiaA n=1 Tax=Glaciecola sp. (strain KUL10) TaxID=2161813 RepID=UPI000D783D7F|nr:tRNA (adenosine(37)-N6)-dimethylallyltransferase MiaA [Glaciecola sp. KUL10]GBL04625.1 tRNA delta(2)-isopentenylpyrophosphate transferase [Glaciecola sp. KUL10]
MNDSSTEDISVVSIMGPTASGKTGLAIELANILDAEVISVDSALIYKHMNIGTAKPDKEEQEGVIHHLLDIIEPEQAYSVAEFRNDCVSLIHDISARGKLPILAGGTMMYFNALVRGLSKLPESDPDVRGKIQSEIKELGLEKLHAQLSEIDPFSGLRIHANDTQRITRALEVYRISGKTMTALQAENDTVSGIKFKQFSIMPTNREVLHKRIESRFDIMLNNGFEHEVEALRARGTLNLDMPSMRCVGYRQMWQYLDGQFDANEMRERGIIATRQLAKRQITWLRGWDEVTQLETNAVDNIDIIIKNLGS